MSEQTANLCTTDACESLRARLAKYEDAEGRPVGLKHDQAELVGLVRDLALRSGKAASPVMHAAALALESQAREIERLGAELESTLVSWGQVRLELAALKAQPSGVVLPERMTLHGSDGKPTYETKAHNACLDEVARLNPSRGVPVEPAHSDVIVPAGVTLERDIMGTMHIKVGDFDFIQIQYQYPYTDNSGTWKLAEKIAELISGQPLTAPPSPDAELVELLIDARKGLDNVGRQDLYINYEGVSKIKGRIDAKLASLK
jgi:ElaB/YqjD/DUF883 family membrane-anchored ribosome-binding protein